MIPIIIFESNIQPKDFDQKYLSIINCHSTYKIVKFIGHYMKHVIDMFILSLYTSRLLQPLDINVCVSFKYISIKETDTMFEFSFNYILQMDQIPYSFISNIKL